MGDLILTVTGNSFSSYNSTPFTFTGDSLSVDWGDGTVETYTSGQLTHTYSSSGDYTITITGNITSIGTSCFYRCTGLTNITIPNSVTTIGEYCFSGCTGLTNIIIPNNVTSLGKSCFYGCNGLTNITIPNNVTSIGWHCFYGCTGLTNITIPNNVTTIGGYCFSNCSGLENIIFEPSTPPSIGNSAFNSVPTSCVVHVPTGSLSAYTSASNCPSTSLYTYVEYTSDIFEDAVSVVINGKEVESIILSNNRVLYQKPSNNNTGGVEEYSLTLTSNKNILSYVDSESAIITATLTEGNVGVSGESISFNVDGTITTATTDSNGVANYTYSSVGDGDITISATYGNLTESINIEDCYWYNSATNNSVENYFTVPSNVSSVDIYGFNSDGWKYGNVSSYTRVVSTLTLPSLPFSFSFDLTETYNATTISLAPNTAIWVERNPNSGTINVFGVDGNSVLMDTGHTYTIKVYSDRVECYKDNVLAESKTVSVSESFLGFDAGSNRYTRFKNLKVKSI